MRIRACGLLLGMVMVGACSSGTAPMEGPGASIAGSWATLPKGYSVPSGPPGAFVLTESGTSLTGAWASGGPPNREVEGSVLGSYTRPNIVLVITDTAGGSAVDTVTGAAQTTTTIVVGGTTYYKQ
jgi:hypothetical protein